MSCNTEFLKWIMTLLLMIIFEVNHDFTFDDLRNHILFNLNQLHVLTQLLYTTWNSICFQVLYFHQSVQKLKIIYAFHQTFRLNVIAKWCNCIWARRWKDDWALRWNWLCKNISSERKSKLWYCILIFWSWR